MKPRYEVWFDGSSKRYMLEDTKNDYGVVDSFQYEGDANKEADRRNEIEEANQAAKAVNR